MLSLMSSAAIRSAHLSEAISVVPEPQMEECSQDATKFDSPADAMDSLLKLVLASVAPSSSITVRVNLPAWTIGSSGGWAGLTSNHRLITDVNTAMAGLDLHDLRALHARSLAFVHSFVNELRAHKLNANYKLTVSNATSYTLLRPTVDDSMSPQTEMNRLCAKLNTIIVSSSVERERAYLTTISDVPALIIT